VLREQVHGEGNERLSRREQDELRVGAQPNDSSTTTWPRA
jgi:hypothetical protein